MHCTNGEMIHICNQCIHLFCVVLWSYTQQWLSLTLEKQSETVDMCWRTFIWNVCTQVDATEYDSNKSNKYHLMSAPVNRINSSLSIYSSNFPSDVCSVLFQILNLKFTSSWLQFCWPKWNRIVSFQRMENSSVGMHCCIHDETSKESDYSKLFTYIAQNGISFMNLTKN